MRPTGFAQVKLRALQSNVPIGAHLEITYRCNWRCVFCCNARHFDRGRLSAAEWQPVLDDLRVLGTLTVTLTGGEALTHPEFFTIARSARDRGFAVRLFSNGALVTERVADQLAELRLLAVEMSLHGATPEVHDRATASPGSWRAMWRGLAQLRARGVRVALKTPLTTWNEDQIDGMIELCRGQGLRLSLDGTITERDDGDCSPLRYAASAAGTRRMMDRLEAEGRLPAVSREENGVNCGVGRSTLGIDPEGNVYPCLQWRHTSLGNVRERRITELWRSSPRRAEAAATSKAANEKLRLAGGAASRFAFCPAVAHQRTGDALQPDPGFHLRAQAAEAARGRRTQ